ncbi:MAG: Hpt domain-containing protein [Lachnospiraceae bacterium]|nr:Hpt domain-containing protein [Lachnospiraceae bacterium]
MTEEFKNELVNAGVDYNGAVERFIGSEEIYEQFLYRFTEDKNLMQLEEFLAKGDINTAFKRAHTLKGLSGNYGFNKMYEATVPVVEILRKGSAEGIEEPLKKLKEINSLICNIINKYKDI